MGKGVAEGGVMETDSVNATEAMGEALVVQWLHEKTERKEGGEGLRRRLTYHAQWCRQSKVHGGRRHWASVNAWWATPESWGMTAAGGKQTDIEEGGRWSSWWTRLVDIGRKGTQGTARTHISDSKKNSLVTLVLKYGTWSNWETVSCLQSCYNLFKAQLLFFSYTGLWTSYKGLPQRTLQYF